MISKSRYSKLKKLYGSTSSWAVWGNSNGYFAQKDPEDHYTPEFLTVWDDDREHKHVLAEIKKDSWDMSVFDDPSFISGLNDKYVFVGLNKSRDLMLRTWEMFHAGRNDYRLAMTLMNTKFQGSYMTDIIKDISEADSRKVMALVRREPLILDDNIKRLDEEIKLIGDPVVIALGSYAYNLLIDQKKYKRLVYVWHYSGAIRKAGGYRQYYDDLCEAVAAVE